MMFICEVCQYASTSKLGKCPDCQSFGSFIEAPWSDTSTKKVKKSAKILDAADTNVQQNIFHSFASDVFHRVFSGWLKQGGIYLLWGEPGIGKSTLVLHIIQHMKSLPISYFSGEEQTAEITRRAERVIQNLDWNTSLFHTTSLEDIIATLESGNHKIVIIDSIQTIASYQFDGIAWSPWQVKSCADALVTYCRKKSITLICLWHVTKWWEIAWPKYLEHIVDVVLHLDWDRFGNYRTLRCTKNRFWSADDAIVFAMTPTWLEVVGNDFRVHDDGQAQKGRVLTVWLENWRPILVHVEALLTKNYNNHPQRNALWIDPKRLQLIIAILEKYCKCSLYQFDIFVNIPGEFTFYDSWIDVAIAAAIYSQYKDISPDPKLVYMWEIWLSWQVVKPKFYEKRTNIVDGSLVLIDAVGRRIEKVLLD